MRPIIAPPPTVRCEHCGGELRLKKVEAVAPVLDIDVQILICVGCGHEQTLTLSRDPANPYKTQKLADG